MVSFAEACLFSALEGEAKFWITLYQEEKILSSDPNHPQEITNFPQQPYFA